ncbi:MAG: hypothetical protein CVU34_07180 [Betaproteobacteria bacterium HGW-Betaproteobacteria-7]|jgi:hypothetical protein|nr:MAG: hypothetical protein CVU34_07180 [Betaproteobacteria bacterium HGW-Betaproteobacteria-7]
MKQILGFALAALLTLTACDRSPTLPNPVESKDGVSYIPIDDTAFLIPEKTWLKGAGRNSTDGLVCCIDLHATIPDVQPWSKARHEEMYWQHGPGKRLDVYLKGDRPDQVERFYDIPQSIFSVSISSMVEEPSELAAQGLRKYRQYWPAYSEKDAERGLAQFGAAHVESRRRSAGKPMMDSAYYELLEDGRMKYFIRCNEGSGGLFEGCHLYFPVSKTVIAEVHFVADHLKHVVSMADKLSAKLQEFQAAGLAYRRTQSSNPNESKSGSK